MRKLLEKAGWTVHNAERDYGDRRTAPSGSYDCTEKATGRRATFSNAQGLTGLWLEGGFVQFADRVCTVADVGALVAKTATPGEFGTRAEETLCGARWLAHGELLVLDDDDPNKATLWYPEQGRRVPAVYDRDYPGFWKPV